jgi:3-hydroxybutyryl-CoA dehydrogenase
MNIENITVIGSGTMGNGIAHVFALNGFQTTLIDTDSEKLDNALNTIEKNLQRQAKKEIITNQQMNDALNRIKTIVGVENSNPETDIVIEAVFENLNVKKEIFNKLNGLIKSDAIFASNTSSISITELANSNRPERFIGMHFMNPVPMMKLVEIIRGYSTTNETYEIIKNLSQTIGKVAVEVQDYPGFISNRILMPMINEAIFSLYEGVAKAEDIDTVMKLGMNHPMGPLTLADFIGLDVCLAIMNVLHEGFNDPKYRACPLLKKMVAAGKLGRKTKEGFFVYE